MIHTNTNTSKDKTSIPHVRKVPLAGNMWNLSKAEQVIENEARTCEHLNRGEHYCETCAVNAAIRQG